MEQSPPSKVCHIRSLPNDVTDSEVVQLGIPFGRMSNVLLLKQKNQVRTRDLLRRSILVMFSHLSIKHMLWKFLGDASNYLKFGICISLQHVFQVSNVVR